MDKEWKEKWVAALRSGEYKQIQGFLHTEGGFCCLGVLTDIVDPQWQESSLNVLRDSESGSIGTLPSRIRRITNLGDTYVDELTEMNDSGHTFEKIATYVEENL
jgi:hypothetical protein